MSFLTKSGLNQTSLLITKFKTEKTTMVTNMNSNKPGLRLLAASIILAMSPLSYSAEEEVVEEKPVDDNVVVITSTRKETDLMKTSLAVSVFDQESLTQNGVKDIRDMSDMVPNFDVSFSPSDSGVQMTMRGINSNNFTEIGDPSVAFHVDGVYSPRPQGAVALMFDLERLEIMRGPQGTLFGRNSAAGSVNVITAKPTTDGYYGTVGTEAGNWNHRNVLWTFNIPVTDDFAIRTNYFREERDGFADQDAGTKDWEGMGNSGPDGIPDMDQRRNYNVQRDDFYGNASRWAFRVAGRWEPTELLSWQVTLETAKDHSAGWPIAPNCEANPELCQYNGGGIDYVDPNIPGFLDMQMDAIRSHVNYSISDDMELVYNFGWARQTRIQQWDGDMGWRAVPGPYTGWLNRYQPWPSLYLATADSDYVSISNELQLQGDTEKFSWIVGAFNFTEDNAIIFDVEQPFCCSLGALGGISFLQPERLLDSKAIFGQTTWHASDKWHYTLGFRYTEDTRQDRGGRNYGCFGGGGCSFSRGLIPFDGWPQTPGQTDELLLPQFTSADLLPGMGAQDRLNNYQLFDVNDNKESFYNANWRIGVDYDMAKNSYVYAYAATGSKAGAFGDGVDVCRCGRVEIFEYEPEEVLNYEIGFKGDFLDRKLRLTVAAFLTDFTNKQVTQFRTVGFVEDPPGTPVLPLQEIGSLVTSNAGRAEIKGLEVEWIYRPWDNGKFTGGVGFLDAKFLSWPGYAGEAYFCEERAELGPQFECIPQDDGSGTSSIAGNEMPYAAPISFTLDYTHDFALEGGATLTTWTKFHWEDEMHFTEGNFDAVASLSDKRDEIGTLDMTLRYTNNTGEWWLEAYAYNATDERFQTYLVDGSAAGAPLFTWNAPRSVGIRAAYNFDK
ncbi:MAG: TonB-dependent receptor [Gammaproteobacteria bacterium]|nr:TonB-dependent receptor [Gammaproteobacteria bacterium]